MAERQIDIDSRVVTLDNREAERRFKSTMKLAENEIRINVSWGKLAALTWGDPRNPPILLCHGRTDVCSGFRPLVSLLPSTFYYVSVELPGNGRSDPFPKGARYTMADLVPVVLAVQEHFNWEEFIYIGHSVGAVIGKYFNLAYPGIISRIVELDPMPAYSTWEPDNFSRWYHLFYGEYYRQDRYEKYTAGVETAPKYTYEKAQDLMMSSRKLSKEASKNILERCLEPVGDGLYRFTYDQRQKEITRFPFSSKYLQELYTSVTTPTFCFLSKVMMGRGVYDKVPFIKDEKCWPNSNYRFKVIEGGHDFHISNPEYIADDISKFLMEQVKAKL